MHDHPSKLKQNLIDKSLPASEHLPEFEDKVSQKPTIVLDSEGKRI